MLKRLFDDLAHGEVRFDFGDFDLDTLTDFGTGDDDDVSPFDAGDSVPCLPMSSISTYRVSPMSTGGCGSDGALGGLVAVESSSAPSAAREMSATR